MDSDPENPEMVAGRLEIRVVSSGQPDSNGKKSGTISNAEAYVATSATPSSLGKSNLEKREEALGNAVSLYKQSSKLVYLI